ncbi:MAG: aldehyde dehydrogenase family protein [Clostridia bacterium]|nr:aldehyde dehydrogenase family protein [Clostridia bacterium]
MFNIIEKQKNYFNTHATLSVSFRVLQLKRLRLQIKAYYDQIITAFAKDLNKKEFDVVVTEIGLVMMELNYMIRHLKSFAKPKRVQTSLLNFPSKGIKIREPYGCVLVASPWNYPFQLTMIPVISAIAGGNTLVVKPSRSTPNVTNVIKKMLSIYDEEYVHVVTKEDEINQLFDSRFDFIFYTGSLNKARELMEKQAKFLTPMILELGGKSPCIVDSDANVDLSAKRIVWGKFLNAGQTCVAPDYILIHSSIKDQWLESAKKYIEKFYYEGEELSNDFVKIVNKPALERLQSLIDPKKIYFGGKTYGQVLEPTILIDVKKDDAVMQEEIFGPIMPIIEFTDFEEELKKLANMEHPLAFYYFGNDKDKIEKAKMFLSFGGGAINDTVMHLSEKNLPFGGLGNSGMGSYHGKQSFLSFTHEKSVLMKSNKFDLNLKYPPANQRRTNFLKKFFRI